MQNQQSPQNQTSKRPTSMLQLKELRILGNMSARECCPRCDGCGFRHESPEKHLEKYLNMKCKKCSPCLACVGSGIVVGMEVCKKCNAYGFIHSIHAPRNHDQNLDIRCIDCTDCAHCLGKGVVEKGLKSNTAETTEEEEKDFPSAFPKFESSIDINSKLSPAHFPVNPAYIHPHLLNSLKLKNTNGWKKNTEYFVSNAENVPPVSVSKTVDDACPKCTGNGFTHLNEKKHDKLANQKCKYCVQCNICSGSGLAGSKKACTTCNLTGFIHTSDRIHDAPERLRCFFCKTCHECGGLGVKDCTPKRYTDNSKVVDFAEIKNRHSNANLQSKHHRSSILF